MTTKNNNEAINELRSTLSRLKDDMAMVQTELKLFKKAVAKDMSRLVATGNKIQNDVKLRKNG